jgi:hypothetical protein
MLICEQNIGNEYYIAEITREKNETVIYEKTALLSLLNSGKKVIGLTQEEDGSVRGNKYIEFPVLGTSGGFKLIYFYKDGADYVVVFADHKLMYLFNVDTEKIDYIIPTLYDVNIKDIDLENNNMYVIYEFQSAFLGTVHYELLKTTYRIYDRMKVEVLRDLYDVPLDLNVPVSMEYAESLLVKLGLDNQQPFALEPYDIYKNKIYLLFGSKESSAYMINKDEVLSYEYLSESNTITDPQVVYRR